MSRRATYRGAMIDIEMMKMANQGAIAVGNSNYNSRGDLIGRGGMVLKTREELDAEIIVPKNKSDAGGGFGVDGTYSPVGFDAPVTVTAPKPTTTAVPTDVATAAKPRLRRKTNEANTDTDGGVDE